MELVVKSSAESDLEEIGEKEDVERILKKLSDIEDRLELGVEPETAIEKRLSGNWSPMLQQRVGDYRLWFVEGSKTENGNNDKVYCIRILSKDDQQKLMGVNINPETYL
ncbi:MAG: type II toxin-antitoxin system RelE/ParE family toxin [Candidatus Nanohaloarchaea archaeon]